MTEEKIIKVTVPIGDAINQITALTAEISKLSAGQAALAKGTEDEKKQYEANKIVLKDYATQKRQLTNEVSKEIQSSNTALGAYQKLQNEYSKTAAQAKNLAAQYGINDKRTIEATKSAKTMSDQLKQIDSSLGQNQRNVGNYSDALNNLKLGYIALAAGVIKFLGLANENIELYDKQVKAEKSLEVAIGFRSEALVKLAGAMQEKTRFADEDIIQGQAYLAQMKATESQILKLTPAIVDFASAQNMDLDSAFKLVAKSLGSSTNALKRYGIDIEGAAGSNARLESALTNLNDKFKGQAEAMANIGSGPAIQLSNAWGDLREKAGRFLAEALLPTTLALKDIITPAKDLTEKFNDQVSTVLDLTQKTTPLITRYEELKKKTTLNKDEQIELKKIIVQIGEAIPNSVTRFDEYGNAIEINAKKAKQYVDDQVLLMKYLNKEEIKAEEKKQEDLRKTVLLNIEKQKRLDKTGKLAVGGSQSGDVYYATEEELVEFRKQRAVFEGELKASKLRIQQLNGDSLKQEIANREKSKKDELNNIVDSETTVATSEKTKTDTKKTEEEKRLADLHAYFSEQESLFNEQIRKYKKTLEPKDKTLLDKVTEAGAAVLNASIVANNALVEAEKNTTKEINAEAEKRKQKKIDTVFQYANASADILQGVTDFSNALAESELATWATQNADKANFDEEYAAKKAKIDHDTAVRNKAMQVVNATINGAAAVVAQLGQGNIAGAITAGITAALQIATIIATPIPSSDSTSSSSSSSSSSSTDLTSKMASPLSSSTSAVSSYGGANAITSGAAQATNNNILQQAIYAPKVELSLVELKRAQNQVDFIDNISTLKG